MPGPIRWVAPTYHALHHILTNPVYAGAYTYGKTRYERYVDEHGAVRKRMRHLPMDQWAVLIRDHHPGFIDWATFQANQARLDSNTRPMPHQAGGAVREGSALLQGIATCGHCGRRLHVHYRGRNSTPGYHCAAKIWSMAAACTASMSAVSRSSRPWPTLFSRPSHRLRGSHPAVASNNSKPTTMRLCRNGGWKWSAPATRRNGPNAAIGPWNPKIGWWLADWKRNGRIACEIWPPPKRNCADASNNGPTRSAPSNSKRIQTLGSDIRQVWSAPTTTDRDRKELLRTLLEEVIFNLKRAEGHAHLTLRWRGGAITTWMSLCRDSSPWDRARMKILSRCFAA